MTKNQQLNSTLDSTATPRNAFGACAAGKRATAGASLTPYSPLEAKQNLSDYSTVALPRKGRGVESWSRPAVRVAVLTGAVMGVVA